jgi:Spy/CpxP family protein refolding chaperone
MENKNYNILKWSVGILALLNIVLLLNMWRKPHDRPMQPPMHMEGGPKERIISELKFTPDQIDLFVDLIDKHRKAMDDLKEKGREIRTQYFDLLKQEQPDQKIADDLSIAIANNQKEIEKATFEHFRDVRKLCSAQQKVIFDKIIGDILKHMAKPPHGGGPPH